MAFESTDALATLDGAVRVHAPGNSKLPELDRLVQTATDQVAAVGGKGDRVHTVLVAIWVLQTLHQVTSGGVPHADALVQGTGSHVAAIGGHGYSSNTILDAEGVDKLAIENIPQTNSLVSTTRGDEATITSKVQRVDVLLVSTEDVLDGARVDIPNLVVSLSQLFFSFPLFLSFFFSSDLLDTSMPVVHFILKLTRICLSSAPVARYLPSGLKQTLRM